MILQMAWRLGKESIHSTLDHVLHEEDTLEMRQTAESVEQVKRIDELHAREHGHYVIVDIKVSVDPNMTVEDGHRVGKEVKRKLLGLENVQNVFVHINPYREERIN